MAKQSKHEFALYWHLLTPLEQVIQRTTCSIDDDQMLHRLTHVLRLEVTDIFVMFDRTVHARVCITEITKKKIVVRVIEQQKNKQYKPILIFLLPLLKRESLEEAVYALTEVGISTIQLVITDKVQRSWHGQKELERLNKIIIAAAEQAKNFSFPELKVPVRLELLLQEIQENKKSSKFFFDPSGEPLLHSIERVQKNGAATLFLAVGPEGDLTPEEKMMLKQHGFMFTALTPTILRAQQAAFLAGGSLRSCIHE